MKDVKIGKELLIVLIAGVVILSSGIFYFVYSRQSPPKEPGGFGQFGRLRVNGEHSRTIDE
ncbi:MAG: hypothetical protein HYW37_00045 [Candidatus Colwellbacteria bacterium]|nr:hypothetical protein [Candidatus Colwellbacteria bacterium]